MSEEKEEVEGEGYLVMVSEEDWEAVEAMVKAVKAAVDGFGEDEDAHGLYGRLSRIRTAVEEVEQVWATPKP